MKILKLLSLFLIVSFASCDQDDMGGGPDMEDDPVATMNAFDPDFVLNYGATITRDLFVRTVDLNNNPIANVALKIGNSTAETDANGLAIINDAPMYERFGFVVAEKTGFIHASRAFAPTASTNHVTIMMLPATVTGSTASGEATTISNGNGASVALSGNYINPDGSAYTGTVDVILHYLDPSEATMNDQMPGMLYAQDAEGEERMLQTLGMLAVELRGANGEDLNLAADSPATISVPVDASLLASAPATIPLWYFDETNGVWIEEGEATLQGDTYVGEVYHFSFWNCDIPTEAYIVCFEVLDEDGNPITNQEVQVVSDTFGATSGITNSNGEVCGYVPANETLTFNVISDACPGSTIYTTTFGPITEDQIITINVTSPIDAVLEQITGVLQNCDGDNVTNGYVTLDYLGFASEQYVTDGTFTFNILRCTDTLDFTIQGFDIDSLLETSLSTYTMTTPTTNVGTILACDTITEFIQYTVDDGAIDFFVANGIEATFSEPTPNTNVPSVTIYAYDESNNTGIYMYGQLNPAPYIGLYDFLDWQDSQDTGFDITEFFGSMENNTIMYNLTSLGAVGEYIDISFSGTYDDQAGITHTISGTVHVLRDN